MGNIINLGNYEVDESAFAVRDVMQGVLDRVVAIYSSYGVPLPSRQYWTMGNPAMDCEQLVVTFVQAYLGIPGDEASQAQKCNMPRSIVVSITVTREIPTVGQTGRTPTYEKIQDAAEISAVDSWILLSSLNLLDQWDDEGYGPGVIGTLTSMEPQGGLQTMNLQVTMVIP
jgi:hypothetical protein